MAYLEFLVSVAYARVGFGNQLEVCPVFATDVNRPRTLLYAFGVLLLLKVDGRQVGEISHVCWIQLGSLGVVFNGNRKILFLVGRIPFLLLCQGLRTNQSIMERVSLNYVVVCPPAFSHLEERHTWPSLLFLVALALFFSVLLPSSSFLPCSRKKAQHP